MKRKLSGGNKMVQELELVLEKICVEYGERLTGSLTNQQVANFTAAYFNSNGYRVELQEFPCLDWRVGKVELLLNGRKINAKPSYYTPGCQVEADYVKLASVEELEKSSLQNRIAVLHGQLAVEQLMPKSFTFYNPEHHQKIIGLLEEKEPLAIVAVVNDDISIFEDGDFDIPSVYVAGAEEDSKSYFKKCYL